MTQPGKKYVFRPPTARAPLVFWAERGLVNIVDERFPDSDDRSFQVVVVREWLLRLRSINQTTHQHRFVDERNCQQNFIDDGIDCAKEAQAQGRPDDPKATAEMLRLRRRSMLFAGGSAAGAMSNSIAPEAAVLPPLPRHPEAEPVKPRRRSIVLP